MPALIRLTQNGFPLKYCGMTTGGLREWRRGVAGMAAGVAGMTTGGLREWRRGAGNDNGGLRDWRRGGAGFPLIGVGMPKLGISTIIIVPRNPASGSTRHWCGLRDIISEKTTGNFSAMTTLRFNREFAFRYGVVERLTPLVRRVVARNPGPFTFHGTATFIIGNRKVAVLDPGPALRPMWTRSLRACRAKPSAHHRNPHPRRPLAGLPAAPGKNRRADLRFRAPRRQFPAGLRSAVSTVNSYPITFSATAASCPRWTGICGPFTPPATAPTTSASPCPKKTRCFAATN